MLKRIILFLLIITSVAADTVPEQWYRINEKNEIIIPVYLFMSSNCPHCHKADAFFTSLHESNPWIETKRYVINDDKEALKTFYGFLQHFNTGDFGIPAIIFCDSRWVGFGMEEISGKALAEAMAFCRNRIAMQNALNEDTVKSLRDSAARY